MTELLWAWYPIKVGVLDEEVGHVVNFFFPFDQEKIIRKQLADCKYVNIGMDSYFWTNIRYIKHVKWDDAVEKRIWELKPENREIVRSHMLHHAKTCKSKGPCFKNPSDVDFYLAVYFDNLSRQWDQ